MTRTVLLCGALLMAAGAAACHPAKLGQGRDRGDRDVQVAQSLTCPERQSRLRLTNVAPDRKSCEYAGPDGQTVMLTLMALNGRTPQEALAPVEAEFRALVPAAAAPEPGSLEKGSSDEDGPERLAGAGEPAEPQEGGPPVPPKPPEPPQVDSAWRAARGRSPGERVTVNLPFLHIEADGATDRARIRAFGTEIDADGRSDHAVVRGNWNGKRADINAHDGGVEMRFGAVGERRADLTYIVASDAPGPGGVQSAAYVARGPVTGPLVVATARGRDNIRDRHDEGVDDLKALVDRNVRPLGGPR